MAHLFARLDDEETAASMALAVADADLLARVEAARALHDESLGAYVAGAVRRFASLASDEDYVTLKTRLEGAVYGERALVAVVLGWSALRDLAAAEPPKAALEQRAGRRTIIVERHGHRA